MTEAEPQPEREEGNEHEAAADAEEAGHQADRQASRCDAAQLGNRAIRVGLVMRRDAGAAPRRGGGGEHHGDERQHHEPAAGLLGKQRAAERAERGGRRERQRQAPADEAVARRTRSARRGGDCDDHERRRRRRPGWLAEHVDEHRQREDRASTTDGADDQADR